MKTYTMEQWNIDGTLKPQIGQEIEAAIIDQLFNCMTPKQIKDSDYFGGFAVGEPYSDDEEGYPLYMAFGNKGEKWFYIGLKRGF